MIGQKLVAQLACLINPAEAGDVDTDIGPVRLQPFCEGDLAFVLGEEIGGKAWDTDFGIWRQSGA